MAIFVITATTSYDPGDVSFANQGKGRVTREIEKIISSLAVGSHTGSIDVQSAPTYASGTLTLSTASGTVGGTIGGKAVTVTASGGDTATAAAIAAAINADTTANQYVTATSAGAVVTVQAIVPGTVGNGITLTASGTGVTASGTRLAGGVGAPGNSFAC